MSGPDTPGSLDAPSVDAVDAQEVHEYLTRQPPQLPPRWLYDSLGSILFDAICLLPWYRITRAETQLLSDHAAAIVGLTQPADVIELGCGNGQKIVSLLTPTRDPKPDVYLVDVSADALERTRTALRAICVFGVTAIQASYEEGLARLPRRSRAGSRMVLFLGSNIGNFDPPAASEFISLIRRSLTVGDTLLIGVDLVKPERDLMLAYDDPLGLTAAFNLNLLLRLNREAGTNFNLEGFRHRAVWNARESRVEMHLVSIGRQEVVLPGINGPLHVSFEPGESIWTESSYKYEADPFKERVAAAGFSHSMSWHEPEARFLLSLFQAR